MSESLATTQGRAFAQDALKKRREESKTKKKIDNARLYAGSSMYYYCISCDGLADVLPECHWGAPKQLCNECQALKDLNWLE